MTPAPQNDQDRRGETGSWTPHRVRSGPSVAFLLGLTASTAFSLALFREQVDELNPLKLDNLVFILGMFLGGPSLIGVPVLLWHRSKSRPARRRRWRPGELLWFAHGSAAWLLWPPMVFARVTGNSPTDSTPAPICYFYGTPLMAVYMLLSLWTGGWLRRHPRKARGLGHAHRVTTRSEVPWTATFGLILGVLWALVGLLIHYMIYANKFR